MKPLLQDVRPQLHTEYSRVLQTTLGGARVLQTTLGGTPEYSRMPQSNVSQRNRSVTKRPVGIAVSGNPAKRRAKARHLQSTLGGSRVLQYAADYPRKRESQ